CLAVCSYSFFFFQAEDGIRDYKVTGVQTCALPIFIARSAGGTWAAVDHALRVGLRGLPGGSSLSQLLAARRGYRHPHKRLTLGQILRWADAHRARTGRWPTACSGPVSEAPGETWIALDARLRS